MDKLKIIKGFVLFMSLAIAFLLYAAGYQIISKRQTAYFDINLQQAETAKISQIYSTDQNLFITIDDRKIFIVDLRQKKVTGQISINQERDYGEKK